MNILVTGSGGFVGKLLCKEFQRRKHSVRTFDIVDGNDIADFAAVKRAVKGIHVVYHLAAVLDESSGQLCRVNVDGTRNLLEASAKQHVQQFIFLSTVGVMGNIRGEANEKTAYNPETSYERSKAAAEKLVVDYQEMLPVTIVRSALVLGPNEYWREIVNLVAKGFPLIGNGKNHWQTIYVKDLVSALLFVLGKQQCIAETFIAAGKEKPTLRELYAAIQHELGIENDVKTMSKLLGILLVHAFVLKSRLLGTKTVVTQVHLKRLLRERNYSTKKITALGWQPKYGFQKALHETVVSLK